MREANDSRVCTELPEGFEAVRLMPRDDAAPLALCLLVRRGNGAAEGGSPFVSVRHTMDARVLLGCLLDRGGRIHGWVDIWFQQVAGLAAAPWGARQALSNSRLDERWVRLVDTLVGKPGAAIILTGWEREGVPPLFYDPGTREVISPVDSETGRPWALCRDDELLERHGLAPYATSLHRYLYISPANDAAPVFVPVTPDAPVGKNMADPARITGGAAWVPVNPEGGLAMVCPHAPLAFGECLDVLGGGAWEGLRQGRELVDPTGIAAVIGQHDDPRALFMGTHGRDGRLLESLHIKLCLLADAVESVRALVKRCQRPLLNLSDETFRVRFVPGGMGLPLLWTADVVLADAGDAVVLPIQTSDARYFLRACPAGLSVYRPDIGGAGPRGVGDIRIRKSLAEGRKGTIVEGTLRTQERLSPHLHDLAWLRVTLDSGVVDLYATLAEDQALAAGEWRFRTVPQELNGTAVADLKKAEGVPLSNVPFELLPLLSTPCDLYGLGVLAVRTLLVDKQTTLPVALDELLSLARQTTASSVGDAPLAEKISVLMSTDPRWAQSLGPQHVIHDDMPAEEAWLCIPAGVWHEVLASIVRMLPGVSADATCRDFGDVRPGALETVFDAAREDFSRLIVRSRNLIVNDWRANREARDVISSALARCTHA